MRTIAELLDYIQVQRESNSSEPYVLTLDADDLDTIEDALEVYESLRGDTPGSHGDCPDCGGNGYLNGDSSLPITDDRSEMCPRLKEELDAHIPRKRQ